MHGARETSSVPPESDKKFIRWPPKHACDNVCLAEARTELILAAMRVQSQPRQPALATHVLAAALARLASVCTSALCFKLRVCLACPLPNAPRKSARHFAIRPRFIRSHSLRSIYSRSDSQTERQKKNFYQISPVPSVPSKRRWTNKTLTPPLDRFHSLGSANSACISSSDLD